MKKINLFMMALIGAATLTLTSCKDECKDVVCENGGTCNEENGLCECPANFFGDNCETECINGTYGTDGTCGCDAGYEGDACGDEMRTKFLANWTYTTGCAAGSSFNSEIKTSSEDVKRMIITNLTGYNDNTAYALVDGSTFTVPAQSVVDEEGDTWQIEGTSTASLANNSFDITIKYTYGGTASTCVLAYSK